MSTTFTTEAAVVGYYVACCDGVRRDTRTWPADASHELIDREHAAACTDPTCIEYEGGITEPVYDVAIEPVDVGRGRDATVLRALGYAAETDGDLSGEAGGADFLGRVLTALALAPYDEGMPAHGLADGEAGRLFSGGRWVECGRRPGYLQDVLCRLRTLAEVAAAHGWRVTWA